MFNQIACVTASAALIFVAWSGSAVADDHSIKTGYALAANGNSLVTMADLGKPDEAESYRLSQTLDAIAYRPVTGELLGFSRAGAIFSIDPDTGALTDLNADFADNAKIGQAAVAFDFNNQLDAVRAVGSDRVNLVYFPSDFGDDRANKVLRFTDVFYADGDANEGTEPLIFANAYTNAIAGQKADSTVQYALDARSNSLVSLANNAGELKTIAKVTIDGTVADFVTAGGFDIVSAETGSDEAFAILQMAGADTAGLYSLDLTTGQATLLADLGSTGFISFAASLHSK